MGIQSLGNRTEEALKMRNMVSGIKCRPALRELPLRSICNLYSVLPGKTRAVAR